MSAATELRHYTERSNAIHREYLGNRDLLSKYKHFVAWQLAYMLPFYDDLRTSKKYGRRRGIRRSVTCRRTIR